MDTTPEYILQCENAVEIQVQRDIERDGDLWHVISPNDTLGEGEIVFNCHDEFEEYAEKSLIECAGLKKLIWLPRQDQLQEMVEYPDLGSILRDIREFWGNNETYYPTDFYSMEQLWLSFVMKEKFGKVLNGGGWI